VNYKLTSLINKEGIDWICPRRSSSQPCTSTLNPHTWTWLDLCCAGISV